jgi:hypothetical protein
MASDRLNKSQSYAIWMPGLIRWRIFEAAKLIFGVDVFKGVGFVVEGNFNDFQAGIPVAHLSLAAGEKFA